MSTKGVSVTNHTFLKTMFAGIANNCAGVICGFLGDPFDDEGARKFKWKGRPFRPDVPTLVLDRQNNYVCVSSFSADSETRAFFRRKAQFKQMHALMVDDIGTKVAKKKITLPLTALVETSPGNFQGWYFLNTSAGARDLTVANATVKSMVASGLTADGRDPGMNGVTRYGRMPVGINGKAKYVKQLGKPFVCRTAAWNPERRYALEEIAKAYKVDITAHSRRRAAMHNIQSTKLPRGEATKRVDEFERMMKVLADEGMYLGVRRDWHDIVCPWVDAHTDQRVGGSALYNPAASNAWLGGYKCHHGHCEHRTVGDIYKFVHQIVYGAP